MKSSIQAAAGAAALALAAQYTVIDRDGHIVADAARTTAQQPRERTDRTFHPDDAKALTVDQSVRAWQTELDRLNPPVVTGGG